MTQERIAIIGAGIAGLACARALRVEGFAPDVFDKGRRVGGRFTTKRVDGHQFDHGAQFFRARDPAFREAVADWTSEGWVAHWAPTGLSVEVPPRYVATTSMRALPEALAKPISVRLDTKIAPLAPAPAPLALRADGGEALGVYDRVVITAPAPQAIGLLRAHPELAAPLAAIRYAPCWALLVEFAETPDVTEVTRSDGPIAWAAREASKPGRPAGHTWTVHASPSWSRAHLEREPDDVAARMLDELASAWGAIPAVRFRLARRWRYALVERALERGCLHDPTRRILVAGDGLLGGRVEAAWLSGRAAAAEIYGQRRRA